MREGRQMSHQRGELKDIIRFYQIEIVNVEILIE